MRWVPSSLFKEFLFLLYQIFNLWRVLFCVLCTPAKQLTFWDLRDWIMSAYSIAMQSRYMEYVQNKMKIKSQQQQSPTHQLLKVHTIYTHHMLTTHYGRNVCVNDFEHEQFIIHIQSMYNVFYSSFFFFFFSFQTIITKALN